MRYSSVIRARKMQPRFKHRLSPPLRVASVFTPRNFLFLVTLCVAAVVWSRQIGLFSGLDLGVDTFGNTARDARSPVNFEHGTVTVDRVIWYEGDADESDSHVAHSQPTHSTTDSDAPASLQSVAEKDAQLQGNVQPETEAQTLQSVPSDVHRSSAEQPPAERADGHESSPPSRTNRDEQASPSHLTSTNQSPSNVAHDALPSVVKDDQPRQAETHSNKDAQSQTDTAPSTDNEASHERPTVRETETQQGKPEEPKPVQVKPAALKDVLNFTPRTAINFMHFHKTGGVSFKTLLHNFCHQKYKKNGQPVVARDACYVREGVKDDPAQPTFALWRCDWEPLREMSEEERNKHDFLFGHQFWGGGVGDLLNKRDVRSFTILRHPFDRKVSFFYHFFVREIGRKEKDVTYAEIKDFLLYDKLQISADLGRDLGPNYMAGRLLSDGIQGFVGNSSYSHYAVAQDDKPKVAEEAMKLLRKYIFVGLQTESNAAKCMLRKVVETFNEVNGVDSEGVDQMDREAEVLNRGSYSLAAEDIWSRFTEEEKIVFDRKERVDLLIYAEGERLFKEHVRLLGCTDRVQNQKYKL